MRGKTIESTYRKIGEDKTDHCTKSRYSCSSVFCPSSSKKDNSSSHCQTSVSCQSLSFTYLNFSFVKSYYVRIYHTSQYHILYWSVSLSITMRGINMKDSPSIRAIFERDEAGNYTKDALLYQNILQFSIVLEKESGGGENSFKERELARWLIGYNQEFANEFKGNKTRMNYRIENRLPRIKARLNNLVGFFLIRRVGLTKQRG